MASFKPSQSASIFCALLVAAAPCVSFAQAPPPGAPAPPAVLNKLWDEATAAYAVPNYPLAAQKLEDLLKYVGSGNQGPVEQLRFNLGLAYLLDGKNAQAEKAFADCLKQFPTGEYASRCYLGMGRALMGQGKNEGAIDPLKRAAADPKYRGEAGFTLGQVYTELKRDAEALNIFRSLMGSDVRTPQQTAAAVEMLGLLAQSGKLDELVAYLDRLVRQPGVRDSMAWYANQVIVRADQMVADQNYQAALLLYRSVIPRAQILLIQRDSLVAQRKDLEELQKRVDAEKDRPVEQRSNAAEQLNVLKTALDANAKALEAIEQKEDLDAALLMRRGRCLYYLDRYEEALLCFREIRLRHPKAEDLATASYAEIAVLNKMQKADDALARGNEFLRKFPDSENVEQVGGLVIESLMQNAKWAEVAKLSKELSGKFTKSQQGDRWVFFQAKGLFNDGQFADSIQQFKRLAKDFPNSELAETAYYHIAMGYFLTNNYKETLAACNDYLKRYPNGVFTGDILYRLAFVDFNDNQHDQSDRIIKNLGEYLAKHPNDPAAGSMYLLIADTWSQKKKGDAAQGMALAAYKKAVWTESPDDVLQYALESATSIMQGQKDWAGIAALHGEFLKRKPTSPIALVSANWLAKMKIREGKGEEAAAMLADALRSRIGDPASEQAELLIDQLVKALVPKRAKPGEVDVDAVEKKVTDTLTAVVGENQSPTANARIYYARAMVNAQLKRGKQADLYIKGIALNTEPSALSPALLSVAGEVLLKEGELDKAEAVYQRLADRYKDSLYADAGPVGLGRVALARKRPEMALKILTTALEKNPGMSSVPEAMIAQLQALSALNRLDEAEKLALSIISDKSFRGEKAGRAYLELAQIYRKRAASAVGDDKHEKLAKAHGYYQRVYLTYRNYPEICAEGLWQAYEVLNELNMETESAETLRRLAEDPKLENTERAKKAKELAR